MTNMLFAGRLFKGQIIELPKIGGEDQGYIEVLNCDNPEQVEFKFVLFDSEGKDFVRTEWAYRETDGEHDFYRVFGWKVLVFKDEQEEEQKELPKPKVEIGSTKTVKMWTVKVVRFNAESESYELSVAATKRGKYRVYFIKCSTHGIYMPMKFPIPKYALKAIVKWLDVEPKVFIEEKPGIIDICTIA